MKKHVGIRELKQNASQVIREVVTGDVIEVTDHGVAVAQIVPLRRSRLKELELAGLLTKATLTARDVPRRRVRHQKQTLSDVLCAMRDEETR